MAPAKGPNLSVQSRPLRVYIFIASPLTATSARYPSYLISCSHSLPTGTWSTTTRPRTSASVIGARTRSARRSASRSTRSAQPSILAAWSKTFGVDGAGLNPQLAMWGPIIANVWWGIPFFAITLLAALQAIPRDLYEAASIDGAGPVQRFWSITLPFLAPTIAITVLLRTVWISNFADLIIVMTNGGPADRTQIVASYIFTQAFKRLDFGYASAIALVLLVLLLAYSMLIVLLRQSLLNKD